MYDLKYNFRLLFFSLVCAVSLFLSPAASAQTVTGTLQGTVSDSKGAVVPGADVVIRNMETGQERNVKTGSEGTYLATFLPLGRYTVTTSSAGFSKVAQENIEVTLNQTIVVNFTLNPSSVTEAVVVITPATADQIHQEIPASPGQCRVGDDRCESDGGRRPETTEIEPGRVTVPARAAQIEVSQGRPGRRHCLVTHFIVS